jgi:hypothetical protein
MQIFILIPSEAKIFILALFVATFVVVSLRRSLYNELRETNKRASRLLVMGDEEGIQMPIINRLRHRYQKASQDLEQVNTVALIDNLYRGEKLSFANSEIQYDQAESLTKALPNLLITAGLIGTFWGIANNLHNISETIGTLSQGNANFSALIQELKRPLQDMGIAFSTSLFGILLGSFSIIANTIWNTNIAKRQLIAILEDYLDNIYKVNVEGNSRLDKAVDRMVRQQEEFLRRFHDNVGRALEVSFGRAAQQIAEECSRMNEIAEQIYTNFSNASGTISSGATTFEQAANSLKGQNQIVIDSISEFKSGISEFRIAVNKLEQNNIVQNIDRVLTEIKTTEQSFTQSTQALLSTQRNFTQSTHTLQNCLEEIKSSNQKASQLAQEVYEGLKTSNAQIGIAATSITTGATSFEQAAASLTNQTQIVATLVPEFRKGVTSFVTAANKVHKNNIVQDLNNVIVDLANTQQAFTSSTQVLEGSLAEIISSNQNTTQIAQQLYHNLEASTNSIKEGANTFGTAAQIISDSFLAIDPPTVAKRLQVTQTDFANSIAIFKQATKDFQSSEPLQPALNSLDIVIKGIAVVGENVTVMTKNNLQIAKSIQTAISESDRMNRDILQTAQSSAKELSDVHKSGFSDFQTILVSSLKTEETLRHNRQVGLADDLKNHLSQMNTTDQESFQRIIELLKKLDTKFDDGQKDSDWLNSPSFGLSN